MLGFIFSVFQFLFYWILIGLVGALFHWWGFGTYMQVTGHWIWAFLTLMYDWMVIVGQQVHEVIRQ